MEVNKENLENALSQGTQNNVPSLPEREQAGEQMPTSAPQQNAVSKEEEIGFHKGALNTLVNERNELFKMIQNVEAVMQAHIKRLEQLGVNVPVANPQQ